MSNTDTLMYFKVTVDMKFNVIAVDTFYSYPAERTAMSSADTDEDKIFMPLDDYHDLST